MKKKIVFISHISEEKELAIILKNEIEIAFLGLIEVFVSSDDGCIFGGERWLNKVTNALEKCIVELVLCSEKSINRPWINFESGAGWIRKIPVIPICHSNMKIEDLPVPLNELEAFSCLDKRMLQKVFDVIAREYGMNAPRANSKEFLSEVAIWQNTYAILDNKSVNYLGEYCNKNKPKSIVSYADRAALQVVPFSENGKWNVRADINFEKLPLGGHNQEFCMVLFKNIPSLDWSVFHDLDYQMEIEYEASKNIKGLQLEIKNDNLDKVLDEFMPNSEGLAACSYRIKKYYTCSAWKNINEICFTLFHGDDYISDQTGCFVIKNIRLIKGV